MLFIPFPLVVLEVVIFFLAMRQWGFFPTLGFYLLPCLLGLFIVTTVGRLSLMTLQGTVAKGQMPASQMLHSGALFISGLLFLVPSFATRVLGLVLFLPGLRHIAVWRFKIFMAQQAAKGAANWQGFRFYRYGPQGMEDFSETRAEREVHPTEVLDVTPLEITHERKRSENPE